jgi:cytidylate kinase
MAIIAINQQLGSRGDELGQLAADALGYRFWGRREIINAAAREYNVEPDQFLIIDERQPHFWERPKVDADRLRAFLRASLFKEMAKDRIVFASSSGAQLMPANGRALRVRAMAALPLRIRHIMAIEGLSSSAAEKRVRDHDREVKARALSLYNFDIDDAQIYDLVLNTSVLPLSAMVETLRSCTAHIDAWLDGNGIQELRDAALAAQVRAALLSHPKFGHADINVECARGAVRLNGPGLVAPWDDLARQVAAQIDGVTSCEIGANEPPMPLRAE